MIPAHYFNCIHELHVCVYCMYTMELVYSGHPGDHQNGCYREVRDLLAQVKIHAIDSIWTLPPGCYREVTCLYSDRYIYRFHCIATREKIRQLAYQMKWRKKRKNINKRLDIYVELGEEEWITCNGIKNEGKRDKGRETRGERQGERDKERKTMGDAGRETGGETGKRGREERQGRETRGERQGERDRGRDKGRETRRETGGETGKKERGKEGGGGRKGGERKEGERKEGDFQPR